MPNKKIVKPFWSWNDDLKEDELLHQIDVMKNNGIDGFFMHARGGLITPYMGDEWFHLVEACIKKAEKLGMEAWIYDENGWPSGFADGAVPKMGFDYQQKLLKVETVTDVQNLPKHILGIYKRLADGSFVQTELSETGNTVIYCTVNPYYTDLLNEKAVGYFIEKTHEQYFRRLTSYFGKSISGFFTDEPQYSVYNPPWTNELPDIFYNVYGYSLLKNLPCLFFETGDYKAVRSDFYGLVAKMFQNAYLKQIYDWCEAHRCKLTGHMMGEDGLYSQVRCTGGVMACYRYFHEPGIDWLGRQICSPIIPKQLGSVAKQLGRKTLSESFAMCGWDVSLNELKWISQWQFVNGVTAFCPHLEGYSLRGARKRDYPASLFSQLPWFNEVNSYFTEYIGRVGELLDEGTEKAPLLVLQPMQSAYIAFNPQSPNDVKALDCRYADAMQGLSDRHILHHYGDETIIAEYGSVAESVLKVGQCEYRAVLLPYVTSMTEATYELLKRFGGNGGKIFALDNCFSMVDGRRISKNELAPFITVVSSLDELRTALKEYRFASCSDGIAENGNIHYTERIFKDGEHLYYFVNLSKEPQHTEISLFENDACIYSPVKNNCIAVPFKNKDDRIAFSYDFAPYGSVLIKCGVKESISPVCNDIVCSVDLKDEWQIKTCSPNALTLDFCKYRIDDGDWQNPCTVIQLQQKLLQLKKPCKIEMEFSFRIEQNGLPDDLSLCMENPQLYRIEINGKPFEFSAEGYFVDKSIVKCNIAPHVKSGVNTIGLSCNYYQSPKVYEVLFAPDMCASERNKLTYDTELESIYLVGSFGVKNDAPYSYGERRAIHTSGDFCLTSLPKTVNATHITESGFWFFSGALELTQRVIVSKDIKKRYRLSVEQLNAPAAKVFVNGNFIGILGFAPYCLDITDLLINGENEIEIKLFSGNRNLLGPHHKPLGESYTVCPDTFTDKNGWSDNPDFQPWTDSYSFVRFGFKP